MPINPPSRRALSPETKHPKPRTRRLKHLCAFAPWRDPIARLSWVTPPTRAQSPRRRQYPIVPPVPPPAVLTELPTSDLRPLNHSPLLTHFLRNAWHAYLYRASISATGRPHRRHSPALRPFVPGVPPCLAFSPGTADTLRGEKG